jgi:hypothetical protein
MTLLYLILAKFLLYFFGIVFMALSPCFPLWLHHNQGGSSGGRSLFISFLSLLGLRRRGIEANQGRPLLEKVIENCVTICSIASSIIVAGVILLFTKENLPVFTIFMGVVTLLVLSVEIVYSLYLSVLGPFTSTKLKNSHVFRLIAMMPLGLGLIMLTLASLLS